MKFYTTSKISDNMHETPEGYLLCVGVAIARTGEMVYGPEETPLTPDEQGKVLVRREADEVFRPETMASFEGKSITITHPEEFVDPKNWATLTKGIITNVRRGEGEQENDLIADLLITDDVAINLVKNGLREVSCGYEAEYTQTGEGRGLQTEIIGNHLALVDQGRAGTAYAINDHKGKGFSMKVSDKIKAIFARAQDEALKAADEEKPAPKKDDAKDGDGSTVLDDVMKAVKDLAAKVDAIGKSKDEEKPAPKKDDEKKDDAKDEEGEAPSMEERMKKLETAMAAISEKLADKTDDEDESEGEEQTGDEDEKSEDDDDFEESTATGDTASRMEILAPGFKSKSKDAKFKALEIAFKTKDGKEVIESINGGKPVTAGAKNIDTLFIAASELLKVSRSSELGKTKTRDTSDVTEPSKGPVTAEMLNEINAKHYGKK